MMRREDAIKRLEQMLEWDRQWLDDFDRVIEEENKDVPVMPAGLAYRAKAREEAVSEIEALTVAIDLMRAVEGAHDGWVHEETRGHVTSMFVIMSAPAQLELKDGQTVRLIPEREQS